MLRSVPVALCPPALELVLGAANVPLDTAGCDGEPWPRYLCRLRRSPLQLATIACPTGSAAVAQPVVWFCAERFLEFGLERLLGALPRVHGAAAGIGLALRNLAPKSRSIGERYLGNHRKYRCLAPNWPAP